jgi:protein-disulfide isomerase
MKRLVNRLVPPRLFALVLAALLGCGGAAPDTLHVAAPGEAGKPVPIAHGDVDRPAEKAPPSENDGPVPIGLDDAVWGSRTAMVTMVAFSDFQCPFCGRAAKTVKQLQEEYGPETLRVVFKHYPLPFHPEARAAAEWAQGVKATAGDAAFWTFHDLAFGQQDQLGAASYKAWAQRAGASGTAVEAGVEAHAWAKKIEADEALAKKIGVSGTPTFFIDGVVLSGAQPIDKFREVIDQELAKSKAQLASGTPPARLYRAMVDLNFKAPKPDTEDDDAAPVDTATYAVPVGASPVQGPPTALVTVVEFADYQCPFCARVQPTIKTLQTQYGKDLRVVFKHDPLPFHPGADPAAHLAVEARAQKGDAGFWAAHDWLFSHQQRVAGLARTVKGKREPELDLAALSAFVRDMARDLGLDAAKLEDAAKTRKHRKTIDADLDLADDVKATGTPHFFVNGRRLIGAQPAEAFRPLIDEELKKAQALVAAGTEPAKVYAKIVQGGKTAPPPEKKSAPPVPASAPFRGAPAAPVVIQEFADFQCPFCKRAEDTLAEILAAYPGKVKIVWRHLPLSFHANARAAAMAAQEALAQKGQAGFWKMHDLLFANQDKLGRAELDGYARTVGLDMARFAAAVDGGKHEPTIKADEALAQALSVSGTPGFLVNDYFISGAQPFRTFKRAIEAALRDGSAKGGAKPK